MGDNNKKKMQPWRIIVFIISALFIRFMWVKNDVAKVYATASEGQIAPLIVTTIAVTLLKVAVIAGGVLLIKWIIEKTKRNKM